MSTSEGRSAVCRRRCACVVLASVFWSAAYAAYLVSAGPMQEAFGPVAGAFGASALCVGAAFVSIRILVGGRLGRRHAVALCAAALAANLAAPMVFPALPARLVTGLSLLLAGFGAAVLLAEAVESPRYIVPMCLVAALADAWSVAAGPSAMLVSGGGQLARHVFVSTAPAENAQPVAGVTDVIFVALLLCLAQRLDLGVGRSAVAMYAGLAVGLATASVIGGAPGIPFIAAPFVIAHWPRIRPGRKETTQTALFAAVMLLIFAIVR